MLASLAIRNFVLIEDATLDFSEQLTALTGETGAGKTLLTKALGLLMGERAEEGLVGNAGEEALIQAVFDPTTEQLRQIPAELRELTGMDGPGEIIVTRRLGKTGRNRCYVNAAAVTLATMAGIVGVLLSFAGQHEYRRLLDPVYQLAVLDRWAGPDLLRLLSAYQEAYSQARESDHLLEQNLQARAERLRELELLRFQTAELVAAGLSFEEEATLQKEQRVLSRAEELQHDLGQAAALLRSDGAASDAAELIGRAAGLVGSLVGVGPELETFAASLREAEYALTELARELRRYVDRVNVDPERLEAIDERLRVYADLARKYGGTTGSAIAHRDEGEARLALLEQGEDDLSRLQQNSAARRRTACDLAAALTDARRRAAPALEQAVAAELQGLGMGPAVMTVALDTREGWQGLRESGGDSVEFLLAANPGQPPRSLAHTASGGELSRVLLALKCALAGAGGDETLVFDEIDAGIGGRTAVAVARKLRQLAAGAQVVVVTHLAHVAALASTHYGIAKNSGEGAAVTRLVRLEGPAVIEELCRMMGGQPDDAEAMAHAKDLRERAAWTP